MHWQNHGWRERRLPNAWFDTGFYLDTYPDIATAGIDPLLHWLRFGRAEGRLPHPRNAARRAILAAARPASRQSAVDDTPPNAPHLDAGDLASRLLHAMAARQGKIGLLVSASHDRYTEVVGGMQLVLADEQAACAVAGTTHLHLAPAIMRPRLADGGPPPLLLATIDGAFAGVITGEATVAAIAEIAGALPDRPRRLAVHSILGHHTATLAALAAACGPDAAFWLHDFISLCEGYNLLRNDLDFCAAPPEASMACRIYVHGERRPRHRAGMRALFEAIPFHVLAPSRVTLDFWLAHAALPFASARVCPPATLLPAAHPPEAAPSPTGPLRVAFLGYPMAHKGWPLFQDLAAALTLTEKTPAYTLHHFATATALLPMDGVTCTPVAVDATNRDTAIRALTHHAIEAVIIASPWPETFSFTAHEALAAGAHVLTLAATGNVAALANRYDRVHVFPTEAALLGAITRGHARTTIRAAPRRAPLTLVPGQGSLPLFLSLLETSTP